MVKGRNKCDSTLRRLMASTRDIPSISCRVTTWSSEGSSEDDIAYALESEVGVKSQKAKVILLA